MQNLAETIQKIVIIVLRKVINLCIFYMLDLCSRDLNPDFTFGNCLFGVMNLTKNYDPDKFGYRGYGIGLNARSQFSLPDGSWGKNVIIFRVDNSSSVHVDNKKNHILVLGEGPAQRLDDTEITAEAKHSINFTESKKKKKKKICVKSAL